MNRLFIATVCLLLVGVASVSAEPAAPAKFTKAPAVAKSADGKTLIAFAVDAATDVEVGILDAKGVVVRHLAAGVLGGKEAPPAPLKPGLTQSLEWDGKDDYGQAVADAKDLSVRVRAGMTCKLDRIAGGDPYAFFSREMTAGNHSLWTIAGMEGKPDGSVYVYGTANQMGPFVVRQYDAAGNYVRTVFPFPAGMPLAAVQGWGVNVKEDGTYSPKLKKGNYALPVYSDTLINDYGNGFGPQPVMVHNPDPQLLTVASFDTCQLLSFPTDGSLAATQQEAARTFLVSTPTMSRPLYRHTDGKVYQGAPVGPIFIRWTADKKSFYLSGFGRTDILGLPFWREGQVWKVDAATREAKVWFSLPEKFVAKRIHSYGALAGVALDDKNHVFVCDRDNKRVLVLDDNAKEVRSIPVEYPDDVEYDSASGALYVTVRYGSGYTEPRIGEVRLLKFANWQTDAAPTCSIKLCDVKCELLGRDRSYILINGSKEAKRIWVAFKDIPVQVLRDNGDKFELVKDFYESGKKQRFLGMNRMVADPGTESVFISGASLDLFKLTDWNAPKFVKCAMDPANKYPLPRPTAFVDKSWKLPANDVAVDYRNRHLLLALNGNDPRIFRLTLEGPFHDFIPVNGVKGAPVSDAYHSNEVAFALYQDKGICASPDGGSVCIGGFDKYTDFRLIYHPFNPKTGPGAKIAIYDLAKARSLVGGVRMDPRGNIYIGARLEGPAKASIPTGFASDPAYLACVGKIYKFAPDAPLASGQLYNRPSDGPAKTYDVAIGSLGDGSHLKGDSGFNSRFGVDPYGRIYFSNSISQTVSIIDNEGNQIDSFGTYGNLDAWLAIEGKWDQAKSVPFSWPGSVDATEDYVYVADFVNSGVVRMKKQYATEQRVAF